MLLYGIKLMGEGLELAAGSRLKHLLEKMTKNRFLAVLVGFLITTLIQSSSATTVMVVGFVNTGLMNLTQAIGVIMGANIGTTTTSVLVSLNLTGIAPIAIFIGAFMILFAKKNSLKYVGQALAGFGMLFMGMELMQNAMDPLKDSEVLQLDYKCGQSSCRHTHRRRSYGRYTELCGKRRHTSGSRIAGACAAFVRGIYYFRSEYRYLCYRASFDNRYKDKFKTYRGYAHSL